MRSEIYKNLSGPFTIRIINSRKFESTRNSIDHVEQSESETLGIERKIDRSRGHQRKEATKRRKPFNDTAASRCPAVRFSRWYVTVPRRRHTENRSVSRVSAAVNVNTTAHELIVSARKHRELPRGTWNTDYSLYPFTSLLPSSAPVRAPRASNITDTQAICQAESSWRACMAHPILRGRRTASLDSVSVRSCVEF